MHSQRQSQALRLAVLYALGASAWIVATDELAGRVAFAPEWLTAVGMGKGLAFVVFTSLLLFFVLRRHFRLESEARLAAEETAGRLQELQTIAEHGGEIFYKHTLDHRFTYVSPQYRTLLGYEAEDLRKRWQELLTDNPINQVAVERTEAALRTGERQPPYLVEIRKKDGTPVLLEVDESPLQDAAGKVTAIVGAARDVTEREEAQRALRQIYRSMNEGLALHELVYDAERRPLDYRVLEVNPAYEAITGLKRDQVLGKLASTLYGANAAPFLEMYYRVALTGEPITFETFFAPLNRHLAVSAFSPGKDRFATVFADITKRKEAEQQICLLNQVYALVSRVSEAIVRISDRETLFRETCRIATENGQFALAWIGLLDAERRRLQVVASAGRDDGYIEALQAADPAVGTTKGPSAKALREGRVVICSDIANDPEVAPVREEALRRGFRSFVSLPLKMGGLVIGALSVYADEPNFFTAIITESLIEVAADVSFALDLFERNRQREIEQQRLRLQHSALDAAANAILITDRQGVIQWVNAAFSNLTGYWLEEAVGNTPRILKSGDHDPSFYRQMWETILKGSVWQGEITNKRKDGTNYHEEMTITPVLSGSGEITHFIAIKQDVTEKRKLEQQFLRAQRMQSIGLLAGGVAHDLNNVLAPVLMALPLLRAGPPPEQRDQILETLERSVQRGANIVQQVLTFARGVEVQRVLVQPRHLIREVVKIAEETFPRDLDLRSSVPSNLWAVSGDPTQIHQVLLNLAVNARDAMPNGGQLSITARNVDLPEPFQFMDFEILPGRYVSISVADAGTGIEPEVLERIFEPFFTTKPAGKGTGLGLSTVLGIVKSHGGLVDVKTRIGGGSTFTVFLPAAASESASAAEPAPPVLPQGKGETILLVDDEASILQVTRSMLVANGYKVVTAKEGMQALARFNEHGHSIDAVITDVMMPFMDGLALAQALREKGSRVPILATTGLVNPPGETDRSAQFRELGVRHLLNKPFDAETLLTTLRRMLDGDGPSKAT